MCTGSVSDPFESVAPPAPEIFTSYAPFLLVADLDVQRPVRSELREMTIRKPEQARTVIAGAQLGAHVAAEAVSTHRASNVEGVMTGEADLALVLSAFDIGFGFDATPAHLLELNMMDVNG